jgi:hypothetical protein
MPLVNTVTNAGPGGNLTGFDVTPVSDQPSSGSVKGNQTWPLSMLRI